ncbi:MAG: MAE_28990/MAE_18760 family HEPN-like nuclease [Spirulinaceae cyanobacterium]
MGEDRQSKFIESVLLGLPIPYIFVADILESEDLARLEIIDGTQRIRTLAKILLKSINNLALDIVSSSFDKGKLFSGNIDAKKIRETAEAYGFSHQTNARKTQNGNDLLKIKTNRNDLTHGLKSFEEVGTDATAEELLQIKKRVICYLREILQNIDSYISQQKYLK